MPANVDSRGRCVRHPFVRLQRRSHRTGEWKNLLDGCPLCTLDDKSAASAANTTVDGSAADGSAADESPPVAPPPVVPHPVATLMDRAHSADRGEGRGRSRSVRPSFEKRPGSLRPGSVQPVRARSTSRVRFGEVEDAEKAGLKRQPSSASYGSLTGLSCNGGIVTVSGGMCSSSQSVASTSSQQPASALKAPRYKACKEKMRIQASEIEKVTTMSMDMSIDSDTASDSDSDSDEEDEVNGIENKSFCQPCAQEKEDSNDRTRKSSAGTKGRMERKLEKMALPQVRTAQGDGGPDDDEGTAINDGSSRSRSSEGREDSQRPRSSSFHGAKKNDDGGSEGSYRTKKSSSFHGTKSSFESTGIANNEGRMERKLEKMTPPHDHKSEEVTTASDSLSEEERSRATGTSGVTSRTGSTGVMERRHNRSATRRRPRPSSSHNSRFELGEGGMPGRATVVTSSGSNRTGSGHDGSGRQHRGTERGGRPDKHEKKRSSSLQVTSQVRPDTEEKGSVTGSVTSSMASPDDYGPEAPRPQRRPSRRQRHQANKVSSSLTSITPVSSSFTSATQVSSSFTSITPISSFFTSANTDHSGQACPTPPPPPAHPNCLMDDINNMSLQALQPTTRQPNYTNMTIDPHPNYDDEVSMLSFMGNSVHTKDSYVLPNPDHRGSYHDEGQDDDEEGQEQLVANSMINTNDFDDKGRCRHHPHIKLRKKKLFGKGWKVLLAACPNCCVDELKRIRTVEVGNKKRMKQKLEGGEGGREDRSAASGPRSLASGLRSLASNGSQRQPQYQPTAGHAKPLQSPSPAPQKQGSSFHGTGSNENPPTPVSPASGLRSLASHGSQPQHQSQYQPPPSSYPTPQRQASSFHSTGTPPSYSAPQKKASSFHGTGSDNGHASGRAPPQSANLSAVPPPPPRTAATPRRTPAPNAFAKRSPYQDSYRSAPAPPPRRSPSQDPAGPSARRLPSQDSSRDASVSLTNAHRAQNSQGSPSRDSFRGEILGAINALTAPTAPSHGKDARRSSSNNDSATASLTSDEQISDSGRSGLLQMIPNLEQVNPSLHQSQQKVTPMVQEGKIKKKKSRGKPKDPQQGAQQRGTIHVRRMQWTDAKGRPGTYTGQVNDLFVPSGRGAMEYNGGAAKEGEWKNGQYHKGTGSAHPNSDGKNLGDPNRGGRRPLRSKSREGGRSQSRGRGARGRQRSSSRGRPQQPFPAAA